MSHGTSGERAQVRDMARELARRELLPRWAALDAAEPEALDACWQALAGVGLERALLGERWGGPGLQAPELLAAIEELAVGDGGMALCVLLSNAALSALPAEEAAAIPAGSRWALVPARSPAEVRMTERGLDGHIASALGAHGTDGLVLWVLGAPTEARSGVGGATVTVAPGAPGLASGPDESQMGLRAARAAVLDLSGLPGSPVPHGAGGAGGLQRGAGVDERLAVLLHAGTAAIARGIARRAHEMAEQYARERRQGGVAIIEHDAVADMLSAMAVSLAFELPDAATPAQALALKVAASDAAWRCAVDAVQVFGGTGYMCETGVEKLMRDAKYCQLFPEPNWRVQDLLVSRDGGRVAAAAS